MSEGIKFFDNLILQYLAELHTCMPGRIEKFDSVTMRADVLPLVKKKFVGQSPVAMPLVVNAPVVFLRAGGFIIRTPYNKGDLVLLVFGERAIDNIMAAGSAADPGQKRMHALDDAIVVGGLIPFSAQLPGDNVGDLVIGKEDLSTKVVIKATGEVEITAPKGITLTADDPAGTGVKIAGKDSTGSW